MRELLETGQEVILIPADFKAANKGTITDVFPTGFELKLKYPADGILQNTYCDFFTNTKNGTLNFESYAIEISDDNFTLKIANPSKHKFLQRRKFTRIKFVHELSLKLNEKCHNIMTLDISAGGMKFKTSENVDIEGKYTITLPLTNQLSVECYYCPIRIERTDDGNYIHSGRFEFFDNKDRMTLIQYCTKRSIEIENK